jgi:hypothetical protein
LPFAAFSGACAAAALAKNKKAIERAADHLDMGFFIESPFS